MSQRKQRYLALSKREWLVGVLLSLCLGALIYALLLCLSYARLECAIAEANVVPRLLREDPEQSQSKPLDPLVSASAVEEARIKSLLKALGIATADELDSALESTDSALLWRLLQNRDVRTELFASEGEQATSTVRAVAAMIATVGNGSSFSETASTACKQQDGVTQLANLLTLAVANAPVGVSIANGPGSAHSVATALRARADGNAPASGFPAGTVECSVKAEMSPPIYAILWRAPAVVSDAEVLDAALHFAGATDDEGWASASYPLPAGASRVQVERLVRFIRGLLSEIRNDRNVRNAMYVVTLFRGFEQFLEIVLAVFIAFVLLRRSSKLGSFESDASGIRNAIGPEGRTVAAKRLAGYLEENDRPSIALYVAGLARSLAVAAAQRNRTARDAQGGAAPAPFVTTVRVADLRDAIEVEGEAMYTTGWPIRFGLAALPAIGFLGTVLGIMSALANADSIVRAPDRAAQAIAVTDIGGTLGLAFATTAIALLLGLILRFFADWITARENELVSQLETMLVPLLDSAFWAADVDAKT